MNRRQALSRIAATSAVLAAGMRGLRAQETSAAAAPAPAGAAPAQPLKGRVHHSVCKWCFPNIQLEEFCVSVKGIGMESIELLEVKDLPTLQKHGLRCAVLTGVPGAIPNGLNRRENHERIYQFFEASLPAAAAAGCPNAICFSGNRRGMSDEEGLANCAEGLKRIMPVAEKEKVTIVMELLNSKQSHKDYMADHTAWGVELVKRVGSERFKLLYDIFHMQIMEGDVIATIRANHPYIAHYHTAGVPGRGEIDDTQELNYPAIMRAIMDTGFQGFVAQEFTPKRPDKLASLKQGVMICDV